MRRQEKSVWGGQALQFGGQAGQALRQSSLHFGGQAGQAGIVILLLTIVLLTIGLSIASRSVTDIRLSRQEEETTRAFDAAEAGIEDALRQDLGALVIAGPQSETFGGVDTTYEVSELLVLETELEEGETVEVNLSGFGGTDVVIDWGNAAAGEVCSAGDLYASIVVAIFDNAGNVRRQPYTGSGCDRGDSFSQTAGSSTPPYLLRITQPVNASDEFMRIRAVYSDTPIRIDSSDPGSFPLPGQYFRIHSEAQTTGGETRAVEVTQTDPTPPSIFDFVIFSGSGLEKN